MKELPTVSVPDLVSRIRELEKENGLLKYTIGRFETEIAFLRQENEDLRRYGS